jgi:hypothetical protein
MVSNWAEQMQREYNACGAPLLGHVRKTVYRREDGSVYHEDGDEMLLGVAMYSPGFGEGEVDPLIRDLLRGPLEAPNEPFDVYLRWAMRRVGWAHTGLVAHCWKSREWEMCFDGKGILTYVNHDGDRVGDDSDSVLVHGCKDESLYRIAMGQTPQQAEKMDMYVPPVDGLVEPEPPTETIDSSPPTQIEYYVPKAITARETVAPTPKHPKLQEEVAAAIRSRFILGPVTPEEEASWPCTKQEIVEMLKVAKKNAKRGSKGCVRLSEVVAKFGFVSNDVARRALRHFGWDANPPHTYLTKAKK